MPNWLNRDQLCPTKPAIVTTVAAINIIIDPLTDGTAELGGFEDADVLAADVLLSSPV